MDLHYDSMEDWLEFLTDDIEKGIVYYDNEMHSLIDAIDYSIVLKN